MACCKPVANDTIVQIDPGNFVGAMSGNENTADTEEDAKQSTDQSIPFD